jgi:Transcriptional regulators
MANSTNNSNVNADLFQAPKRKSTVDMVIEKIQELLLTKKLKPGDKLPNEMELTKNLSASRGSVREAMKILESYGVLEIKRGDGTYISTTVNDTIFDHLFFKLILSDVDKRELIELRRLIETGIIKIIIANASKEDIDAIEKTHHYMEQKFTQPGVSAKELTRYDLAFHYALGKATKNMLIEKIYNFTLELLTPSIESTYLMDKTLDASRLTIHGNILEGIKEGNLGKALKAVEDSIDRWFEWW